MSPILPRLDYKDYLRARDLRIWDKDSREAKYVRKLGRKEPQTYVWDG